MGLAELAFGPWSMKGVKWVMSLKGLKNLKNVKGGTGNGKIS
jgi:hypothetical protein